MRKRLLMSVSAIALIASAGIVTAQDKGGMGGGGAAPAPQNSSPAQQSAPSAQPGGGEMRGGASDQAEPRGTETKGGQAEQQKGQKGDRQQRTQDQRQQDQKGAQDQRQNQRENRAQEKSDNKGAADNKSRKDGKDRTTGQGAAGSSGSGSLTTEQRTKISTTIKQSNVRPVTNVNFNISVGTVVPHSVTLHALPATVIEVYPDWRPYRFILVGDEIIIIEPDTYRIIAVIDA